MATVLLQISCNITAVKKTRSSSSSCFAPKLPPHPRRNFSTTGSGSICYSYYFNQNEVELELPRLIIMGFKDGILFESLNFKENKKSKRRRTVLVCSNQGLNFSGGSGGGGGNDDDKGSKVLVNLALAIGLYCLSTTEQFGWILDALIKFWLFVVIVPLAGLGAFVWWAANDSVVDSCPNCGNEFQVFKSMLDEDNQQCPYCSQPLTVVDDKFVKDPVNFSKQSTASGQAFRNFSARSKKGKKSSVAVVDVEAEIEDAE